MQGLDGNWTPDELAEWDSEILEFEIGCFNQSGLCVNASTNYTTFINAFGNSMYPSGYSMTQIIIIALFFSFAMVVIVVGNMLVIIAICTEKNLKHITNWFIASLAVSDLLIGLVIMPFSLAHLLMGYWIFGDTWCELHAAIDVFLSTASINNICLISLDRYWSITHAVSYLKNRTAKKAVFMIVFVWVLSGLVSIPPLLGWKVDRPRIQFPKCTVSNELGYVLYSACGSFYIPSCIMIFVYIQIYYAAKERARRGVTKRVNKGSFALWCGCCRKNKMAQYKVNNSTATKSSGVISRKVRENLSTDTTSFTAQSLANKSCNSRQSGHNRKVIICDVRVHEEELQITSNPLPIEDGSSATTMHTLSERVGDDEQNHNDQIRENCIYIQANQQMMHEPAGCNAHYDTAVSRERAAAASAVSPHINALRKGPSVPSIDGDQLSDVDPSSSDSGQLTKCSVIRPLKMRFCQPLMGNKLTKPKRELIDMGRVTHERHFDPEREKRRVARKKEKRATLILGLIMGSFIACWFPFFFMYILAPVCPMCYIPGYAFDCAFWLGYMNSAFNPVIYTIFNKDFRKAFRKILFK